MLSVSRLQLVPVLRAGENPSATVLNTEAETLEECLIGKLLAGSLDVGRSVQAYMISACS